VFAKARPGLADMGHANGASVAEWSVFWNRFWWFPQLAGCGSKKTVL